ncbi:hypothetical protein NST17_20135 [Caldifermentibacillus hisashii]|uniref:Uncharacterized protein n=1 Tax=Caldifermentibacillus hisashii TaxID=996558 RepID=A0ABU9K3S1_9BACI
MNYYEFDVPYYALIKANNGEEAVKLYIEVVAGEENKIDDILENCQLVPEYYAAAKFARSKDKDKKMIELEEVLWYLGSDEPEVLLIDGSLF